MNQVGGVLRRCERRDAPVEIHPLLRGGDIFVRDGEGFRKLEVGDFCPVLPEEEGLVGLA